MTDHDDLAYLVDMLETAQQARQFAANRTRDDLDDDVLFGLAMARLLEIIGEAARSVSKEKRAELPEIAWTSIVGMRHKIAHDYRHVNNDVVWRTIQDDLPSLITILEKVVPPLENEDEDEES